jgi:IK cytokine
MVTVSVDGSVLDRIAKIMTYLRLGSSGKVLKKKKKERDIKGVRLNAVLVDPVS